MRCLPLSLLCLLLLAPAAQAGPAGSWKAAKTVKSCSGAGCSKVKQRASLTVRQGQASDLKLRVVLTCGNISAWMPSYDATFIMSAPQAGRIGRRGKGRASLPVVDGPRSGQAKIAYDFSGRRPWLKVTFKVSGPYELCSGRARFTLRRASS